MDKFSVELTKDQWSLINLALTKTYGFPDESILKIRDAVARAKCKAATQEETKELMIHIDVDPDKLEEFKESFAKEFAKCFRISV